MNATVGARASRPRPDPHNAAVGARASRPQPDPHNAAVGARASRPQPGPHVAAALATLSTIARYTLLEALRGRLAILMGLVVAGLFGLAEFLGELSLTETRAIKASVTASLLRVFSVAAICLVVIGNGLGELRDKGLETLLSLPMPRYLYLFGRLTGYAGLSLAICLVAGAPLALYAPALPVCYWVLSLFLEHLLMIAFSLLCLLRFADVTRSFILALAFYLLSRSAETLRLLSATPALPSGGVFQDVMHRLVDAFALLLPDLHGFANSGWLVHGVGLADMLPVLLQSLLYLAILTSAALFDLYRKNL